MNSITKEYYFPTHVFKIIKDFILPSEYDRLERGGFNEVERFRAVRILNATLYFFNFLT